MVKGEIIRNLLIIVLFIVFIFLLVIFYPRFFHNSTSNSNEISLISNKENTIIIQDNFPMIDDIGKSITDSNENSNVQAYYNFEVKSNSDKDTYYEIYASDLDYDNTIHSNYIKMYLTDENNKPLSGFDNLAVPTFYNLKVSSLNPTSKRLYYGYIKSGETQKFILRVWVGDAYAVGVDTNSFGMKIYAEAK